MERATVLEVRAFSAFMIVNNSDDGNLGKGGIKCFGRSVSTLVKKLYRV
jgi:hypothetical protein